MNRLYKSAVAVVIAAVSFALVITAVSCAKPPLEEMNNATAAVSRAENDQDVPLYAANGLQRAKEALNAMQTASDAKRYDEAKQHAEEAVRYAEKAISDSKVALQRAKDDAASALSALEAAVTETEQSIADARRTKQKVDFAEIDKDLTTAKTTQGEALTANNDKKYRDAVDKSQTARGLLSSITSRLTQTVIETSRKK
ncbi:MAG: hypothetical protein Ta2B_28160 [Termitinemataceae bacterium]|nr:MAG: hypothetical protein Ta2B_28160 [Termitinemataceae bacterium]